MDVLDIVSDLKTEIDSQVEQIRLILMTGQCKDHEQYKFFTGQLHQLYNMQDFIRSYRKVEE